MSADGRGEFKFRNTTRPIFGHKNKRQFPVDNSTWFMNIYKLGLAELMAVVDGQTRKQTSSVSNNKSVSFSLTKSSHWILFLE